MEQKLGLYYTDNTPLAAIISNRLVDLQRYYSGICLSASMQRSKRRFYLKQIDRHVINLMEAYGTDAVLNLYSEIFVIDNERKAI